MLRSLLLAMAVAGLLPSSVLAQAIGVAKETTVALSDLDARNILQSATSVLSVSDGPADVPCPVALTLQGSVTTFASPTVIDSRASFDAACRAPGRVHVIAGITWCGRPCATCLGCSSFPGSCITLVRDQAALEGIIWAHEYGHNHNLDDVSGAKRVMREVLSSDNREITSSECAAYTAPAPLMTRNAQEPPALRPIEQFVRERHIHGVPYDEARRYGPAAVPRLLELLTDPDFAVARANVIETLGMIGDVRAEMPLRAYLERNLPVTTDAEMSAKRAVPIALGYMYFTSRRASILDYLISSTNVSRWANVAWSSPRGQVPDASRQIAAAAVQALGLTGDSRARATLQTLTNSPVLQGPARDAIEMNGDVLRRGARVFSEQSRR